MSAPTGLHRSVDAREGRARALAAENQWLLEASVELEARLHAAQVRLGLDSDSGEAAGQLAARRLAALPAVAAVIGVLLACLAALFGYVAVLDLLQTPRQGVTCSCTGMLSKVLSGFALGASALALVTLLLSRRPGAGGRGRVLLRRVTSVTCALTIAAAILVLALT